MGDNCSKVPDSLYSIYRDYVKHEDTLLNNRMTLFMTIQSLLIGAFSLLVSAISWVVINTEKYGEYTVFTIIFLTIVVFSICSIGFSSSRSTMRSVKAATLAIRQVEDNYTKKFPDNDRARYPGLTGGGNSSLADDGFFQPDDFLVNVLWFWCFMGALCLIFGTAVAGSIKIPKTKSAVSEKDEVALADGMKVAAGRQAVAGCAGAKSSNSGCIK